MSREYHLITHDRPSAQAFARTLTEAAGHQIDIVGDFDDVDDYLNISSHSLWIEVQPPGHVEAIDLKEIHPDVTLPRPDAEGCLWHAFATVPAGAPPISADVIWQTFRALAETHHGIAIDLQSGP